MTTALLNHFILTETYRLRRVVPRLSPADALNLACLTVISQLAGGAAYVGLDTAIRDYDEREAEAGR